MKTANKTFTDHENEERTIYKPAYFSTREIVPEDFIEDRMTFDELDNHLEKVANYALTLEDVLTSIIEKAKNEIFDDDDMRDLIEEIKRINIKEL